MPSPISPVPYADLGPTRSKEAAAFQNFLIMASFASDPNWTSSNSDWTPFPQRSSSRAYNVPRSTQFEPAAYLYPSHQFALDGIALRAGLLGAATAGGLCIAWGTRWGYWQPPMFLAALGFFHFMEFWITARFNTRKAKIGGMEPFPGLDIYVLANALYVE